MSDAETVGLWLGIFAGIAGIVLSSVAIWFARSVDDRAKQVNDQTIQSLQKIETTVERLSGDTTGLIKAAWDKMLGQVGYLPSSEETRTSAERAAAGISAEVRAELADTGDLTEAEDRRLETLVENIKAALTPQIAALSRPDRPGAALESTLESLRTLSPEAQELARMITQKHLTWNQYRQLRQSPLSNALMELRHSGILVPLEGVASSGGKIPVYYFPAHTAKVMRAALELLPDNPATVERTVLSKLQELGYLENLQAEED